MARISTYSVDTNFTADDKLHGSDENGTTRNFQIGPLSNNGSSVTTTIVNYITECDMSALAWLYHKNNYDNNATPQQGAMTNLGSSTNTFSFSNITTLMFSDIPYAQTIANPSSPNHVQQIMAAHVGKEIKISDINNPNFYGIYTMGSWSLNSTHSTVSEKFYDVSLTLIGSNGSLVASPNPLIYILELWENGDKSYVHTQSSGATTWTVTHNLQKNPAVQIEGSDSKLASAEVTHNSNNQLTITFSSAQTGKAYCN